MEEEKGINSELLRQSFKYQSPSYMYENLNNTIIREINKIEIDSIKTLTELKKNRIKNMSEKEKGTEKPNKIVGIVEKVLGSNKRY